MTCLVNKKILASYVNVNEDDTRYDKVLLELAITASSMIEEFLRRSLEAVTKLEYHRSYSYQAGDPGDIQILWLSNYPVIATPAMVILYSRTREWDKSTPLVEGVDYEILSDKGAVRIFEMDKTFHANPAGFRVSYRGGYEKATGSWGNLIVPTALSTACAMQAAFLFTSMTRGSMGLSTTGSDDPKTQKAVIVDEEVSLIPEVRAILKAFVRKAGSLGKEL